MMMMWGRRMVRLRLMRRMMMRRRMMMMRRLLLVESEPTVESLGNSRVDGMEMGMGG